MSEKLKGTLPMISLVIGITVGVFGAIQSYAVLPYRVDESEKAIRLLQERSQANHELLVRIEERVKQIQERIK